MGILTRLRHAATVAAATATVAKRRIDDLRERIARKDDIGARWDEDRLIAVELQFPFRGWRVLFLVGLDLFDRALDIRLRLLALHGGPARLRFHFPVSRPVHAV